MLRSMTGYGQATGRAADIEFSAEIRSVNNRHLKLQVRLPDSFGRMEADVERLIRKRIDRGAVHATIRMRYSADGTPCRINHDTILRYRDELQAIAGEKIALTELLLLPGVVDSGEIDAAEIPSYWPTVQEVIENALNQLHRFRVREGESMQTDLRKQCEEIRDHLAMVAKEAPKVVSEYRDRLLERTNRLLEDSGVRLEPGDVLREIAVFTDRSDINEEITRLRCHIDQFDTILASDSASGRKLEFLGQEMLREINTIGSKANNVAISHAVVEMKAASERMREILQNIE